MSSTDRRQHPPITWWVGWVAFAAVMLMVTGLFNVITGFAGILEDEIYVTGARGALVFDVTAWGWIQFVLGIVMMATGAALSSGATWARLVAVVVVVLNLVAQLVVMPAYPFWAMLIIAVDVLVIWAIIVHGEELTSA